MGYLLQVKEVRLHQGSVCEEQFHAALKSEARAVKIRSESCGLLLSKAKVPEQDKGR